MICSIRTIFALLSLLSLATALPSDIQNRDVTWGKAKAKVYRHCVDKHAIALTFNDGPTKWTNTIVDALNKEKAKGTFFVNGHRGKDGCIYSDENVQRIKHVYESGHEIASHAWYALQSSPVTVYLTHLIAREHKDLTSLPKSNVKTQLTKLDTALEKILGVKPAFVRPPFDKYDDDVLDVIGKNAQDVVIHDFQVGNDNGGTASLSDEPSYKPKNALVASQETDEVFVKEVLVPLIKQSQANGYNFVTVADCLNKKPYVIKKKPEHPNVSQLHSSSNPLTSYRNFFPQEIVALLSDAILW
ncbi:Carbohydrate esterase 4 protein [Tulasnella sp. 403]|nr:Carbohydrate esterase 4 protein [Tulasnella sp. 403]